MTTASPRAIAMSSRTGSYRDISFRPIRRESSACRPTGNSGGSHNLLVSSGTRDLAGLLREMDTGLLVTELLGQGVNYVTGDYSRGAAGYWVEGGRIVHPVEEITIAGNMRDMFRGIVDIGSDTETRGAKQIGSVLIEQMTVAGS